MNRFAKALKREGLTQSDVARMLNITHQSVNEWATGRRAIPLMRCCELSEMFPNLFSLDDFVPRRPSVKRNEEIQLIIEHRLGLREKRDA